MIGPNTDSIDAILKVWAVVGPLFGASVAAIWGRYIKVSDRNYENDREDKKELERRVREEIHKPVVEFVDELLVLISKAYWDKMDEKETEIQALLEKVWQKEAMIEARVNALESEELSKYFKELDNGYSLFRSELGDGHTGKARDQMHAVFSIAGKLFGVLFFTQPKRK